MDRSRQYLGKTIPDLMQKLALDVFNTQIQEGVVCLLQNEEYQSRILDYMRKGCFTADPVLSMETIWLVLVSQQRVFDAHDSHVTCEYPRFIVRSAASATRTWSPRRWWWVRRCSTTSMPSSRWWPPMWMTSCRQPRRVVE